MADDFNGHLALDLNINYGQSCLDNILYKILTESACLSFDRYFQITDLNCTEITHLN